MPQTSSLWVIGTVRSKIKKKNWKAMINTLQLAKRKNLIQMSSDVITIVTVIINFKFNFKVLMLSKLEEEWSIKRLATHNGLNKSTVLQVINKEAGTRRDRE
jgi:hypothetical protein